MIFFKIILIFTSKMMPQLSKREYEISKLIILRTCVFIHNLTEISNKYSSERLQIIQSEIDDLLICTKLTILSYMRKNNLCVDEACSSLKKRFYFCASILLAQQIYFLVLLYLNRIFIIFAS